MTLSPGPASPKATRFLTRLDAFLRAQKYRMGPDVSGLMTERANKTVEFVVEKVLDIAGSFIGVHGGPAGTREIASDKAVEAIKPFLEFTDLLAWKPSEVVPVAVVDEIEAENLQLLLDAYFQLGLNASNALSNLKYGGFIRVFPLLIFNANVAGLAAVRNVRVAHAQTSFWLHVYLNAGIVTLGDNQLHWPGDAKISRPLGEISSLFEV